MRSPGRGYRIISSDRDREGILAADDELSDERLDLSDLLSHVLDKGVVLKGEVMLAVADIDLIKLDLGLLLTAVESALQRGSGFASMTSLRRDASRGAIESGAEKPIRREVASALPLTSDTQETPLEAIAESLPRG